MRGRRCKGDAAIYFRHADTPVDRHACRLVIATALAAQAPLPGEDWVQLFNGKDLTGWVEVGKEKWSVENGIIHGRGDRRIRLSEDGEELRRLQLAVKFLCEGDGNSGVFFHTDFKPGTADVSQGLQFEVDCTINQHTGGMYGEGRGWIVWPAPENEPVVRQGEWNEYC